MNKIIIYISIVSGSLLTACNQQREQASFSSTDENIPNRVEFTPLQYQAAGIQVEKIKRKNLKEVVRASGYLEVPPQNKAVVAPLMGGVIKNIFVLEGNYVKKGQILATLEHPDLIKLQEEFIIAKSELAFMEKEYQRQKELFDEDVSSGKIFQQTESQYDAAKAKFSSLGNQLRMLGLPVNDIAAGKISPLVPLAAPITGYVSHISASIGIYAEPNNSLFELVDNSQIHCDLFIYEKDLFRVKEGQKVNFILSNLPEHQQTHDSQTIEGEIFGINKSFESSTKALTVHAVIKNETHELIPGMYVNALIEVSDNTVSAVPQEAVVQSEGSEFIFVTAKNGQPGEENISFTMKQVKTGIADLGYVEITPLESLAPDVDVVVKGTFYVLSQLKTGEEEEE